MMTKIFILTISAGIGVWLVYQLAVSGLSPQTIIFLVYVVLVIVAVSLLPAQKSTQAEQPFEITDTTALEETILNIIRRMGQAKRHDFLPQVGLSRSSLGRLLDQMEAKGMIRQEGDRKASYYIVAEKPA